MANVSIKVTNVRHLNEREKKQIKKEVESEAYKQLEKQAKTVFNRVNKRIRNIEKNKKIISPAYNAIKKKRGTAPRFGGSGTYHDMKTLKKEYAEALAFDNMETSSVQGSKSYTDNLKSQIPNTNLDNNAINYIFDALHALHERMPDIIYSGLLQYSDYLGTIVESAENIDFNSIDNYNNRVNSIVDNAIEKMNNQMSDKINEGIDILSSKFNRLF